MPAMTSQSAALRAALFALLAGAAISACDSSQDPMAPEAADPAPAGPGVDAAGPGAGPELLTAGTGPRILFSSARTGGYDIYRMAPDGSGVVRMTSFSGAEMSPAWSWNNARIAMVRDRTDLTNGPHKDIYLMNADGTGKKWARPTTTPYDITDPSWSKDGSQLAVSVWVGGSRSVSGIPYLAVITVANGNISFVSPGFTVPIAYTPSFGPSGKKIVYTGEKGLTLEMINSDGTGHTTIIDSQLRGGLSWGFMIYPVLSPDGKRIAFAMDVQSNWDIYVVTIADGSIKRLTTNAAPDTHPTWSADGTRIAFTSSRSGSTQVWTMLSTGGTQVRITHTSVTENSPAWSH
jgi:Tol biopolymer transport system component